MDFIILKSLIKSKYLKIALSYFLILNDFRLSDVTINLKIKNRSIKKKLFYSKIYLRDYILFL